MDFSELMEMLDKSKEDEGKGIPLVNETPTENSTPLQVDKAVGTPINASYGIDPIPEVTAPIATAPANPFVDDPITLGEKQTEENEEHPLMSLPPSDGAKAIDDNSNSIRTTPSVSPSMSAARTPDSASASASASPAPAPISADDRALLQSALAKKYGFAAGSTDSDLRDAQALAAQQRFTTGMGQAAGTIAAGFAGRAPTAESNAFYADQMKNADAASDNILAQRKGAIQSDAYSRDQAQNDPNGVLSTILRKQYAPLAKSVGLDPAMLNGLSASDLKEFAAQPMEFAAKLQEQRDVSKDRMLTHRDNATANSLKAQELQEGKDQKQFGALGDALDPYKGRSGEFGKQLGMVNAADRVLKLKDQYPDGNLPKGQMAELAGATASLISGGGHAAEGTINQYLPKTVSSDSASIQQWLENDPKGLGQQKFAQAMFDTANREKGLAQSKVKAAQYSRIPQFESLKKKDPNLYEQILQSHGVDPDEYETFKANGYKTSQQAAPSQKVKVSNGTKTYLIDSSDLDAAQKDGFNQIQ